VKKKWKHSQDNREFSFVSQMVISNKFQVFSLMALSLRALTPVVLTHLFVQRVQLWANSNHRQGPGPGVRRDFITPDIRARGDREGGGDGNTDKGWRRMTENGTEHKGGGKMKTDAVVTLLIITNSESHTSCGLTGQTHSG